MPKFIVAVVALLLTGCAGRTSVEVLKGSRKKFPPEAYWTVFDAAQKLLQQDGFIVNLTHQAKGILVATQQRTNKKSKTFGRVLRLTGANFREGDYLRIFVNVATTKKNEAEMRISVLRERENEWTQEDGDEIGTEEFYSDFFKRVEATMTPSTGSASPGSPPAG